MSPRSVFGKFLRDNLRALIGWSAGIVLVTALYSSFYPAMSGSSATAALTDAKLSGMSDSMLQALKMTDLSSPEGYLNATVFSLLVPILMVIAALIIGTRAIAGDEEEGGLELILTYPVSRLRLLVERFAAMAVFLVVPGVLVFATLLVLGPVLDMEIDPVRLAAASAAVVLVALCYGSVAMAAGALTGRRSTALAVGALSAVLGYLGNTFALQAEELEWLRFGSAFYYALDPDPLNNGFDPASTAVLLTVPVVLIAMAAGVFTRRDVAV